jgi:hypothetical protein
MLRFFFALLSGWVFFCPLSAGAWGFFAHERINELAVNLLPPGMQGLFRSQLGYLRLHATDPDKRRYAVKEEGPRHYIDLDRYGSYPFDSLPRAWKLAVARYSEDSLQKHGIVPWWLEVMTGRLTKAFREKDVSRILQNAAEIGHYLSDAHVPLHACSNHNGQYTGQRGIHGLWESRVPELLANAKWNFWIGQAAFIQNPAPYFWSRVLESALASDSVLRLERELNARTDPAKKYAYEERNGKLIRQYSSEYARTYDSLLGGMVERRMRLSIQSVASIWYTCWVLAGQPDLPRSPKESDTPEHREMIRQLDRLWRMNRLNESEHS